MARGRGRQDKYLERKGLLNYQTEGMTQEQIAERYAKAGVQVDQAWFEENYKDRQKSGGYATPQWQSENQQQAQPQGQAAAPAYLQPRTQNVTAPTNRQTMAAPQPQYAYGIDPATGLMKKTKAPGITAKQAQQGKGNWTDVFIDERKRILNDPNFYKDAITKYPSWMQAQILADPEFKWDNLPKLKIAGYETNINWQKLYFDASSSPAKMGAVQGLIMGAGNPGGAVAGAAIGYLAEKTGYDQTKEAWEQGDNKLTWDINQLKEIGRGAFGYMNLLAEWAEKGIGTAAQVASAAVDPNKDATDYLTKEAFDANASFFEVIAPAWEEAFYRNKDGKLTVEDVERWAMPALFAAGTIKELLLNPEKYKGEERYLGAAMPQELKQSWMERLDGARAEIKAGRDYREVMTEMQTGLMAQVGDMLGQGIFDPLNILPKVQVEAGRRAMQAADNKVWTEALTGVETPGDAARKFKNIVTTDTIARNVDPNFDVKNLNAFERMIAGINTRGEIKAGSLTPSNAGLLDPIDPKKRPGIFSETPQSRAQTGAGMFDRNIGNLIQVFKTPTEAVDFVKRIAAGDDKVWAELGNSVGKSAEWYTILPAMRNFVTTKLEAIAQAWELTTPNRNALDRIADVLGENPTQLIEDWATRNSHRQDFDRIIDRARQSGTPESKALIAEADAGAFTPDSLKQIVDIFHGPGALPHTEAQWKWSMYADMSDHFAGWVADHLLLKDSPEVKQAFFQTMAIMKQAQSIVLLGMSPGYAIQNGLSGIVHLMIDGIHGTDTVRQMDDWIQRWEAPMPRVDEGVGIGGMVEATTRTDAIRDAMTPDAGPLTTVRQTLSKIQRGMPMSKLSSKFESVNGKRGYVTALKQFWNQTWRRGVGFRKMDAQLEATMRKAGIDPNRIYAAIEAGANQAEIERSLTGQYKGLQVKAMIDDAARRSGITPEAAADMMDKTGMADTLDAYLEGAKTPAQIDVAFRQATRKMQDWIDMKLGEEYKVKAQEVTNRVKREGPVAALQVTQQVRDDFFKAWSDHYERFGEVMGNLQALDPAQRGAAIDLAYEQTDVAFRRVFRVMAHNYNAIFDAWGMSGNPAALEAIYAIGQMNDSMKRAYDIMRQKRNELNQTLKAEGRPGKPTHEEARTLQNGIDAIFEQAFKEKHSAEVRMGEMLGKIHGELHGEAAGNAARRWWNEVVKFSEKITKDEARFRKEINAARDMGVPSDEIARRKRDYYQTTKQKYIADLQEINDLGIKRLEDAIAGRTTPEGKNLTKAQQAEAEKKAEQDRRLVELLGTDPDIYAAEAQARAQRSSAVLEIAKEYGIDIATTDRNHVINAINKYGEIKVKTLDDARLTPEYVRQVFETRKTAKDAEATTTPAVKELQKARKSKRKRKDLNILQAIVALGGLNIERMADVAPDARYPKLFTKPGWNTGRDISDLARILSEEDGYAIDLTRPDDPDGVKQATELIQKALNGDPVYPAGHDYTADEKAIRNAEAEYYEALKAEQDAEQAAAQPFNEQEWRTKMEDAAMRGDLDAVLELSGQYDNTNQTLSDYAASMLETADKNMIENAQDEDIARVKTQADLDIQEADMHAQASMTRIIMEEKWAQVVGAEKARSYMELSDAVAEWYAKQTGETTDEFYARYYRDIVREQTADHLGDLKQEYERISGGQERAMTDEDVQNYARMLVRDEGEARTAIRNEPNKRDRIALLDAIHEMNPAMAERIARSEWSALMQEQKRQVFYSKLTQTVENIKAEKLTVEQLRGMIKNEKADEIKWSGLDAFLQGKKNVTKTEVLDFLRENQIELGEQWLGGAPRIPAIQEEAMKRVQDNRQWKKHIDKIESKGFQLAPVDPMMIEDGTVNGNEMFFMDQYGDIIDAYDPIFSELGLKSSAASIAEIYRHEYDAASRRVNEGGNTKYSQYVLPGGENYRELLITLPVEPIDKVVADYNKKLQAMNDGSPEYQKLLKEKQDYIKKATSSTYQSTHWKGTPNVLAHTRLNDRIDADGKRVLFVEEIQSDWHQQGREKGYTDPKIDAEISRIGDQVNQARREHTDLTEKMKADAELGLDVSSLKLERNMLDIKIQELNEQAAALYRQNGSIPAAPFQKTWHEMVMKRILRIASEEGYDRVAWTTGEQQFKRWGSQKIDWVKDGDGWRVRGMEQVGGEAGGVNIEAEAIRQNMNKKKNVLVNTKEGLRQVIENIMQREQSEYSPENWEKRMATMTDKLWTRMQTEEVGTSMPRKEGMEGFYDKMLSEWMDKYAKAWGAKTGETQLTIGFYNRDQILETTHGDIDIRWNNDWDTWEAFDGGTHLYNGEYTISGDDPAAVAREAGVELLQPIGTSTPVHSIDVTDSMRESVMQGQPLFQEVWHGTPHKRKGIAEEYRETLYQSQRDNKTVKGSVAFENGYQATIRAFEAADFSTMIHENAHVFRRVMQDVAERTGNKQVIDDIATIEEWANVQDGNWTREAEEKFARGFENYIRNGEAPTPKLRAAFESFKKWMTAIYRTVTGSAIDVQVTPEIKSVFDRLLGAEDDAQPQPKQAGETLQAKNLLDIKDGKEPPLLQQGGRYTEQLAEMRKALDSYEENATPDDIINAVEALIENNDMPGDVNALTNAIRDYRNSAREDALEFGMRGDTSDRADNLISMFQKYLTEQENTSTLYQTDDRNNTPAFHKWFDGSKVVDKQGRPVVMHHSGTFDEDIDPVPQINGQGFHFGTEASAQERMIGKIYEEYINGIELDEIDDGLYAWSNSITNEESMDEFTSEYDAIRDAEEAARAAADSAWQDTGGEDFVMSKVYLSIKNPKRLLDQQEAGNWSEAIAQAKKEGYDGIVYKNEYEDKGSESWIAFYAHQIKSVNNRGTWDAKQKNILWQEADLPAGTVEEAGQIPPYAQTMQEGWTDHVEPFLKSLQDTARQQVEAPAIDGANIPAEAQEAYRKYRKQVAADMAGTKNAATKWGEQARDYAMLNYNKRYGVDRYIETVYPYEFFYTRSMATWAARALDKPALFSQYARLKRQQDRYERDIPERLRGKIKIPMPWMPQWMGDGLYIDPVRTLFTPLNYLRPFERMIQDRDYQEIEAERILQEWSADGSMNQSQITEAIKNRSGSAWERALAEAKQRRQSEISTPLDFMNTMLGPAWYLTTPYKLLKGEKAQVGSTPLLNTTRAIDTVTQGTWAEPVGDLVGMIGKPEEMLRKKLGIPEFGEYGDYYIDRQLANMVADGEISADEAKVAMIERTGANFDAARERVKMELAMRVPGSSALLASLNADNFTQGVMRLAMTTPASLFGAGLLPEGELQYRNLKTEWNDAWKQHDAGDEQAITAFFEEHPEYEAYLAKGKDPEDKLRSYLVGQIWDGYMTLGDTDRKQARAEMGEAFMRDFVNPETRSIEGLDVDTLARWAQMLNRNVPSTAATAPALETPEQPIQQFDPQISRITDKYFADRKTLYPNYYAEQAGYYNIPQTDKSGRLKYLQAHPQLKAYWEWNKAYKTKYPELTPIFNGQVFKRIDTTSWPTGLKDYAVIYAYTGEPLPKGAWKALEQVWLAEGKPGGTMEDWLDSTVAPALLYGGDQ